MPNLPSSLEDLKNLIQNNFQQKLPRTWDIYYLNSQGNNTPISTDIEYAKTLQLESDQQFSGLNLFILPIKLQHHEEHKVAFENQNIPCTDEEFQARRDQGGLAESSIIKSSISSVSSISISQISQKEEEKSNGRISAPIKLLHEREVPLDRKNGNLCEYFGEGKKGLRDLKHRYKDIIRLAQGNKKEEALAKCDELFIGLPEGTVEVLKSSFLVTFKEFQEELKKKITEILDAGNEGELSLLGKGKKKIETWNKLNQMKNEFKGTIREMKKNFREIKREEKQKEKKLRKLEKHEKIEGVNMNQSLSLSQRVSHNSKRLFSSVSMKVGWNP